MNTMFNRRSVLIAAAVGASTTLLQACGGGFCVESAEQTAKVLDSLLSDHRATADAGAAAARYIKQHLGATDVIYSDLFGA